MKTVMTNAKKWTEFQKPLLILIVTILNWVSIYSQADEFLEKEFKYHTGSVFSVAFSPDGNYLLSGAEDKQLVIVNLNTREVEKKIANNYYSPFCIEVSATNEIYFGSGPDIKLIDFNNNKLALFEGNTTQIWSLDYGAVNHKIVAGSFDYKARVWDCTTQKICLVLEGHKKAVLAAAFSPDEKYIATGSMDRTVKIWNAETGKMIRSLDGHSDKIYNVRFDPSGKYLASCSDDKTIRLWDVDSGKVLETYVGHDFGVLDIQFTSDGTHLLSASEDGTFRLWQVKTGKMVYTFTGHKGAVNSIAVNKDGSLIASGGVDGKVILWKLDKKIFVEYAFPDEFNAEKNNSDLFAPRQKNESKDDYALRNLKANELEKQIVAKYYQMYIENLTRQTFE
jgi:WD40 repeat protein